MRGTRIFWALIVLTSAWGCDDDEDRERCGATCEQESYSGSSGSAGSEGAAASGGSPGSEGGGASGGSAGSQGVGASSGGAGSDAGAGSELGGGPNEAGAAGAAGRPGVECTDSLDYDGPIVSPEGWEWLSPLPHGYNLNVVWGLDENHLWAAGQGGVILRYNGKAWQQQNQEPGTDLRTLWAANPCAVWAGGGAQMTGSIVFWDGQSWAEQQIPGLPGVNQLWGADEEHVWAATSNGVWFFDGRSWKRTFEGEFIGVTGADADHVWAITKEWLFHFDGLEWSTIDFPEGPHVVWPHYLNSIWAAGPEQLWVTRSNAGCDWWDDPVECPSRIDLLDANGWETKLEKPGQVDWRLHDATQGHVWAMSDIYDNDHYFFDGAVWSAVALPPMHEDYMGNRRSIFSLTPDHAFIVGAYGHTEELVNGQWVLRTTDPLRGTRVTSGAANNVWAAGWAYGAPIARRWEDGAWHDKPPPATLNLNGFNFFAAGADQAWAFDGRRSIWFDGETWTERAPWRAQGVGGVFYDLSALDEEHVWGVGDTGIHFFDGVSWHWQLPDVGEKFYAVQALATDNVWAVTQDGTVYLYDGGSWQPAPPAVAFPSNQVVDMWGTASSNVWVLNSEFVWHWNGQSWQAEADAGGTTGFDSLTGITPPDVWAVAQPSWSIIGALAVPFDDGPGTEQVFMNGAWGTFRWAGRNGEN